MLDLFIEPTIDLCCRLTDFMGENLKLPSPRPSQSEWQKSWRVPKWSSPRKGLASQPSTLSNALQPAEVLMEKTSKNLPFLDCYDILHFSSTGCASNLLVSLLYVLGECFDTLLGTNISPENSILSRWFSFSQDVIWAGSLVKSTYLPTGWREFPPPKAAPEENLPTDPWRWRRQGLPSSPSNMCKNPVVNDGRWKLPGLNW